MSLSHQHCSSYCGFASLLQEMGLSTKLENKPSGRLPFRLLSTLTNTSPVFHSQACSILSTVHGLGPESFFKVWITHICLLYRRWGLEEDQTSLLCVCFAWQKLLTELRCYVFCWVYIPLLHVVCVWYHREMGLCIRDRTEPFVAESNRICTVRATFQSVVGPLSMF